MKYNPDKTEIRTTFTHLLRLFNPSPVIATVVWSPLQFSDMLVPEHLMHEK
jgi:hypothetical protein